jgi:GT2 family glycosyltransferase
MISIIIPTCNRNNLLGNCLNKLNPKIQGGGNVSYEIIVTDDSTKQGAKDFVENNFPWARWVEGPRRGPASNRNNGAKFASGDWLLFIDDDVLPHENLLNEYHNAIIANQDSVAFEGKILPDDWEFLKRDLAECPVNIDGGYFWTANVCIKKETFFAIDGFDTDYLIPAQEDQQIKLDIENYSKVPIIFVSSAVVVHPVRFILLKTAIMKIPIASKNFTLYIIKNKMPDRHIEFLNFVLVQYKTHLFELIKHAKNMKMKSSILSFCWLVYGVPLNIYYLLLKKD